MKYFTLLLISQCLFMINIFGYDISGIAIDSETSTGLPNIELTLFVQGGSVKSATTQPDGSFIFTNVPNGTHELVFHYYEPVIINGDYYLYSQYGNIAVSGGNVTGITFEIDPHHPIFIVKGTLYDALTNQPLINQDLSLRLEFLSHSGFFFAWSEDDGTYQFADDIPDWTYNFDVFDNDYYYGDQIQLTIDPTGVETITVDFYLQPKSGVSVSGQLLDITTNQPIMLANRTVRITAINSYFTSTNENGEFMFVNVEPGYYANIKVTTEDTSYINCPQSTISDFTVPAGGISGVELYQTPFINVHEMHAYDNTYTPGESKTIRFSLVNDDLTYGAVWGVNLIIPPDLTPVNVGDFLRYGTNQNVFDYIGTCYSGSDLVWEGYHSVFGSGNVGNLQYLNDSVYADVEFQFAASPANPNPEIFYEVFYTYACTSQKYSYGTIVFNPDTEIELNLKAMMEGSFDGTSMEPGLLSEMPLSQPFNMPPWNYNGNESVSFLPNSDIVDWILIELRDASSAANATSVTIINRKAGFILQDGSIVGLDGASDINMQALVNQNLYVVLWARNHLGILSKNALTPSGDLYSYDFTSGENQVYGGVNGHKELAPGIWGMIGGDCNHDGSINEADLDPAWMNGAGTSGYSDTDLTLDGQTDNRDKNDIWLPNNGSGSAVPD